MKLLFEKNDIQLYVALIVSIEKSISKQLFSNEENIFFDRNLKKFHKSKDYFVAL